MSETLGPWLRQQREARSWSRREMARQLIQAGRSAGDKSIPGMDSMCHNIHRWERGQGGLTERYKLHYCTALGIPPEQFGADSADSHPLTPVPAATLAPVAPPAGAPFGRIPPDLVDPSLLIPLAVAYRRRQKPEMGDSVVEREVLMAAHEGSEHAEQAERRDIGEATLEQLHADVARLSAESMPGRCAI